MIKNDMQIPRTYGTEMWNVCTNFKACIYYCISSTISDIFSEASLAAVNSALSSSYCHRLLTDGL